ncbi:MAG: iron-sulfur cluster assembly protein [Flavobacteriaceae bacterium]|nr:iron-sulfur cluster assembly protein [Flavobacteriaceae bacterium]
MSLTNEQIHELGEEMVRVLKSIYDPEIPVDIYELGLIYDAHISTEGEAKILMTLTSPNCPVAESLPAEVEEKIGEIEGISKSSVQVTFEPPWSQELMSEEAKFELGML